MREEYRSKERKKEECRECNPTEERVEGSFQPTEDTDGFKKVSYRDIVERKDEIARDIVEEILKRMCERDEEEYNQEYSDKEEEPSGEGNLGGLLERDG